MDKRNIAIVAASLLGACSRPAETNGTSNEPAPAESAPVPLTPPAPGTQGGLPDDRTPLEEPNGPIDPKRAEAAGQAMQSYGALIEEKRFAEAAKLWGDPAAAAAFVDSFKTASEVHLQVGKPGDTEGAAGSIYVSVPVVLYGRLKSGGEFSRSGTANLRRVNDVDGSSEAQRRWHIAQIDLQTGG
ncbi:MAG: hypothetical protein ABIW03_05815 [Sphingomicrobium sp.]